MATKVFKDKFKGKVMFSIWNVNENGEKISEKPVVSFGGTKAVAIVRHIKELEKYAQAFSDLEEEKEEDL